MHKYLRDEYPTTAREMLTAWMQKRGFTPLAEDKEPWVAYLVRGTDYCKHHGPSDKWNRATILHRGDHQGNKARLRAVAAELEKLDVEYDVEHNQYGFLMLVVTLNDALREAAE